MFLDRKGGKVNESGRVSPDSGELLSALDRAHKAMLERLGCKPRVTGGLLCLSKADVLRLHRMISTKSGRV